MVNKEKYKIFLQNIVDTHLQDESLIFEMEGDALVNSIFDNKNFSHEADATEKLGAADILTASASILGIVSVAFTCFKTILEIQKMRKDQQKLDEDKVKEDWLKRLVDKGIKVEKAKVIVQEFTADLIKLSK